MSSNLKKKSLSMVALMFMSVMLSMISVPTASAAVINQTTEGLLNGQETWTGTHTLTDNVTVAPGASLVVNAGATINIPYGKYIDVRGAICVAGRICGAPADGSASNAVTFEWSLPSQTEYQVRGDCYGSVDAACGSGIVIRNTIDEAKTGFNFVNFENAFGYEYIYFVGNNPNVRYAALVFDGPKTTANGLVFTNVNSSNIFLTELANPTITDSTFALGVDGYTLPARYTYAIDALGAGAGISDPIRISSSTFTGDAGGTCGNSPSGINMINVENSYISLDSVSITDNGFGVFFQQSSGEIINSTIDVNCAAVNTNGFKQTGLIKHTLTINDNTITTAESAGITAFDQAIVSASRNTISGAEQGSGVAIRSSTVELYDNIIGPIGGYNGLWIYGTSEVTAVGNSISNTAAEAVVHGEYHYRDGGGWPSIQPSESRLYMENNVIENNSGTCRSDKMYGGEFECPAIHIFRSSATLYNNVVKNNVGDALRIKGGIVNVQNNDMQTESFAVNISHHDDNYGNKFGSIGYFSNNTFVGALQVYNITESMVTIQSENIPDPGGNELHPINLQWLGAECPDVQNECLKLPNTASMPPAGMPMALELVNNSTVLSFAGLQNFDSSKIHVKNQQSAWGNQVREGELVKFRVKAANIDVEGATVIIKDAVGTPLYTLTTNAQGYTDEVTLASNFYLDRNNNHVVGENNVQVQLANASGGPPIVRTLDENTCSDGYDNDGDSLTDDDDGDCINSREIPKYRVEAFKFGKGTMEYDFTLNGPVDDIIALQNMAPSVTVEQPELTSFARIVALSGTAWDGEAPPYASDIIAQQDQFGYVEDVQIQPPGSQEWLSAVDTSNSGGVIAQGIHPFSTWAFEYDMSNHPEGEGDVTFRIRSFDGLDYSPITVKKYKLNLQAPSVVVNTPAQDSQHNPNSPKGSIVSFSGTASDPYFGVNGNDIKEIWFEITEASSPQFASKFAITPAPGETLSAWQYDWNYRTYASGDYTFKIWAADSDFCKDDTSDSTCVVVTLRLKITNENAQPNIALDKPLNNEVIRGSESTAVSGYVWDNDGIITRVDIDIYKNGRDSGSAANTITITQNLIQDGQFNTSWNQNTIWKTNNLPHNSAYEIVVRSFDGESYSEEETRFITIDNSVDNSPPSFDPTGWANTVVVYCDANSKSLDRCGAGATFDLNQYFTDPEGGLLRFDVYDDPSVITDDLYYDYVSISSEGIATYNPPTTRSDDISQWSLAQLKFIATDGSDLWELSRTVNVIVRSVSFEVVRDGTGIISDSEPAIFTGQGLPNSLVKARFDSKSGQLINSTRVLADGTWSMQISASQLGSKDTREIVFEMDGQIFADERGDDALFELSSKSESESSNLLLYAIIAVVIIAVLIGVGAFFFTFEEYDEEDEQAMAAPVQQDPYAWAKAKQVPAIGQQQQATQQSVVQQQVAQQQTIQQETSQHPGWLWDAQNNQWVPDPNYVHEQQ